MGVRGLTRAKRADLTVRDRGRRNLTPGYGLYPPFQTDVDGKGPCLGLWMSAERWPS